MTTMIYSGPEPVGRAVRGRPLTPIEFALVYQSALDAAGAAGRCPKCWSLEFCLAVHGSRGETYTWSVPEGNPEGDPPGAFFFDVDKATELVGGRSDCWVARDDMVPMLRGHTHPDRGHLECIMRRTLSAATRADTMRPGILAEVETAGGKRAMLIDGTHRAWATCVLAGAPQFRAAVLTPAELDQVLVSRPPAGEEALTAHSLGKLERLIREGRIDWAAYWAKVCGVFDPLGVEVRLA